MKKSKFNNLGFTIVELIVVITILVILSTIGFISYIGYISSSRDGTRIAQVKLINQAFESFTKWKLPLPENKVTVKANWTIIGYQWYAWVSVLSDIWVNEWGKDPLDGSYYTYFIDSKQKYAQILAFLENEKEVEVSYRWFINQANAIDYAKRYPLLEWYKLWILVESWSNTPIQENPTLIRNWLDVVTTTNLYKAYFSQDSYIWGSWKVLQVLQQTIWYEWVWFWAPKECPEGFIWVPGNIDFNQPGFCVMKYEASYIDATAPNALWGFNTVAFNALKIPVSKPWLYPAASWSMLKTIAACKSMWEGYHLITNNERMTIARDIESQWKNWSSNTVGTWWIYRWLSDSANSAISLGCGSIYSLWKHQSWAIVAATLSVDTTKWGSNKWADCDSKRQHILSNWEIIWDISWNVREYVNWANTLDWSNYATMQWQICWADWRYDYNTCAFTSPYSYSNQWPKIKNLNHNNGIWQLASIAWWWKIFMRWASDATDIETSLINKAGIYTLYPRGAWLVHATVGFRCAK